MIFSVGHRLFELLDSFSRVFRLLELEQSLTEERARRETTEEALRLSEDRVKR